MHRSRWFIGAAAVLVIAGLAVRFVGDPTLIRFPLNINQQLAYTGTATVYVNPATGAPLASPLQVPLTINRQVKVVNGSHSQATISETIAMHFAGNTQTETYQYVMDRRSMKLVNSPKSYAFGNTANTMAPNGSFRINMPLGTSSTHTYTAWVPQTASTMTLTPTGPAHLDATSGMKVVTFNTSIDHQVAPYYQTHLTSTGSPASLSPAAVQADLKAQGVDVSKLLAAIGPHLTSTQVSTLLSVFSQPVPLNYSYFQYGQISADSKTGAIVSGGSTREGIAVTPNLSGAAPVEAILAPYATVPAVQALSKAVAALSTPQVVLQLAYNETTASGHAAASTARHLSANMTLVRWQIPGLLVGLGILALIGGLLWRPRREAEVHVLPVPAAHDEETRALPEEHRKGA